MPCVCESFPHRKAISALEIFNMKVRIALLREEMTTNGALVKTKLSLSHLFKGLDNEDGDLIDSASKHVHEMVRSVLSSTVEGWKLLAMLKKMHEKDPTFTYRVIRDNNGCPTGVVWQTPQMRANYERFGNFISIDAMKRQQNALHWPYIGPVVLDENKTVAVIAESIVLGERLDAYRFVLSSIFQMAPKRPKSQVLVIASDCFINESLLEDLGISSTCKLMWDHYHLVESIWPKKLGLQYYTDTRPLLSKLVNARSKESFDSTLSEINEILKHRPDLVDYMQGWGDELHHFAAYILDSYPGSLGRRGSSHSEQNHSSFISTIGSGFSDDPCIALQKRRCNKTT